MATILPNGVNQFIDGNGNPLAGGTVTFYVPNTTTPKDTWSDPDETTLNDNPLTLDSSGEAIIYGSGSYRQIVKDANGNLIWDQLTASTTSGGEIFGGTSSGTPNAQTIAASAFNGTDGSTLSFLAGLTNTGATTLTIGTASPIPIVRDGIAGPTALTGSEIVVGNAVSLLYDAGRGAFHIIQTVVSAFGQSFNQLANVAAAQAALSLTPGTNVQPYQAPQSQGTWNAGVGTVESTITPAKLAGAIAANNAANLPFTKSFSSAQQTITFGGLLTIAHGLGVQPKLYPVYLQCTTANGGFSVGDEIAANPSMAYGNLGGQGSDAGISVWPDATNINVRFGSSLTIISKSSGATNITAASWKLVARAWA